jgi:hypothetical protein
MNVGHVGSYQPFPDDLTTAHEDSTTATVAGNGWPAVQQGAVDGIDMPVPSTTSTATGDAGEGTERPAAGEAGHPPEVRSAAALVALGKWLLNLIVSEVVTHVAKEGGKAGAEALKGASEGVSNDAARLRSAMRGR